MGRTRLKYARVLIFGEEILTFLRRKPRVLFALDVILLMCVFHFRSEVKVTPRYSAFEVDSIVCPFSMYLLIIFF